MYLAWQPTRRPAPHLRQASVLSCLRGTRQVRGRYIAGGDVSHCDSSNQVTPNSSSKTTASPHGCPGLTNPADEHSGQPRPLCPPAKCHGLPDRYPSHQRTAFPAPRAPGNTGAAGRTQGGARPTRRRVKPEQAARGPSVAVRGNPAGTPTVPAARTPSAMRPWMPQHSTQQRDKVIHHGINQGNQLLRRLVLMSVLEGTRPSGALEWVSPVAPAVTQAAVGPGTGPLGVGSGPWPRGQALLASGWWRGAWAPKRRPGPRRKRTSSSKRTCCASVA